MATIGTILIQAANASGSITGPNAPSSVGIGAGGGSSASDDLRHQKKMEELHNGQQINYLKAYPQYGISLLMGRCGRM